MAFHVTRCPGCDSTFNTDPAVLAAAAGKVRCGACLTVFEAEANFLDPMDRDDTGAGNESVFLSSEPQDYFDPSSFFTRQSLQEQTFPAEPPAPAAQAPGIGEPDEPAVVRGMGTESEPGSEFQYPAPRETYPRASQAAGEESGAEADTPEQPGEPDAGDTSVTDTEDGSSEAIRARALQAQFEDEEALEAIPEENLSALSNVPNTLELPLDTRHHRERSIMLALLALILGTTLIAQYLWHYLPLYSLDRRLRPLYLFACEHITCELPVYRDIGSIRSEGLTVRSHPEREDGLIANVSFQNTAPFPQPFPIMILSFNSASNAVISLREFSPQEYLPAQLQTLELMPSRQPIQLSLELIDPGPDAVNYTLAFRRP